MTIWILAFVLVAVCASVGYAQGAIRTAFAFVGIVLGLLLARPLAPLTAMILPLFGITSVWVLGILAPIVAFFLVGIGVKVGATFVHRKVEYHYKYHVSDAQRTLWERMQRRVGSSLGTLGGAIYFVLICVLISTLGYLTVQVGASESNATFLRLFNKMASDIRDTHMDKVVGGMNPAPPAFFEVSDFVGFLAQNRPLVKRLSSYPQFVVLAKGSTFFQAVTSDKDFLKMLETEQDPATIFDHPRIQEAITNTALREQFKSIDLADLSTYLSTGKSPKYAGEEIVGRWAYNAPASLILAKTLNQNMKVGEMMKCRKEVNERFSNATLSAALDGKGALQLPANLENTVCPSLTNEPPRTSFAMTWTRAVGGYDLVLTAKNGNTANSKAMIMKGPVDRIGFRINDKSLVFDRLPE